MRNFDGGANDLSEAFAARRVNDVNNITCGLDNSRAGDHTELMSTSINECLADHCVCPHCSSICESCGRSAQQRPGNPVLCDGLCRDCVEWDFVFDLDVGVWLMVDGHGTCVDCDRDGPLFSVGDGLVCESCYRAVLDGRAAA
jgi:hypothetical protein